MVVSKTDKVSVCVDFTFQWEVVNNKLLHVSEKGDIYFEKK